MWSLPDVLIVHLMRFSNSRFSRDKVCVRCICTSQQPLLNYYSIASSR